MLRSLKVVGAVALTVGIPSVAFANSSGALQVGSQASNGGGSYETSVTVETPPLNSKCPAVMKIHATTTLLYPDGKHFSANAHFQLGNTVTTTVPLDFSKHTTVKWDVDWHDPDLGANFQSGIVALITDYKGTPNQEVVATQGTFQVGCGGSTAGSKPSIPAPVSATQPSCQDYDASLITATGGLVMWHGKPPAQSMSGTLYHAQKKADLDQVADIIKHHNNLCGIPATSYQWFEGEGIKNSPNWGKCTTYDGTNVTVTNDETGWLVKAGGTLIFRVGLEADARTLAVAVHRRTQTCEVGDGTEPSESVFHYLR